ncbi:MAG: tripartite tricarboxylate transporter substrate binding protein [Alphaproteobacteria bacterium]|nr:MAG: tripartite tricarboxylate transporter substrate binding protein [Alphaproteobacteria bacterium]
MLTRRTLLTTLAAAPFASALPRAAFAAYPDKPIRLIVPFAAGGNADFVARLCAEGMKETLGQPIVVEYRTGAGGSLGADMAAHSPPDGYTLFTGSNGPLTVNPFVQAKLGYDPLKDFVAIGLANLAPHCLVVHEAVAAKDLPELIALSKVKSVNVGTSGAGSATHMTLARFNAATAANITHVPYRGGGALIPDLLSGAITGAMTELSTALPHVGGGRVRVLGVAWSKRSPQMADVPTMIEQGVKDFTAASYVGILAPAATPAEIVKTLEAALIKALNGKDLQQKMLNSGAELVPDDLMTAQGFAAYIKKEYDLTREAAKLAGLTPT